MIKEKEFISKKKKKKPGHFYRRSGYKPFQNGYLDLDPPYGWNYLLGYCEDFRNLKNKE